MVALRLGRSAIVTALLRAGADASAAGRDGTAPLMVCSDDHLAQLLLDHGADVHARDAGGMSVLMRVSAAGSAPVAQLLVDRGADVSAVDRGTWTALLHAGSRRRAAVVELLLRARAPVDWQSDAGLSALMQAAGQGAIRTVNALLAAGARVELSDGRGMTALCYAEDTLVARALLAAGATGTRCEDGWTPLMFACQANRLPLVRLLLEHGFDAGAAAEDQTPLIIAARAGYADIAHALLRAAAPAPVNQRTATGTTALSAAAGLCQPAMVRLLLEARADARVPDGDGLAAVAAAEDPETVRLLMEAAPEMAGHRSDAGWTALAYLCCKPDLHDCLAELFASAARLGVRVDVNNTDTTGHTALHVAMRAMDGRTVKLLLENGAEVGGISNEGTTVLMMPFIFSQIYIAQMRFEVDEYMPDDAYDDMATECLSVVLEHILSNQ
jgi:ankyrin repeat protein